MQSTLNPQQVGLHDVVVIAPEVVPIAHADEDVSGRAHDAASRPSDRQAGTGPDLSAGASVAPADTIRAAAVDGVQPPDGEPSTGGRAIRAFIGMLLAVCISVPAIAWQSYGDAAKQMIARWVPHFAATSSPPENSGAAEQPGAQASAANPTPAQSAATAQTAPGAAAPTAATSADTAQLLQSMASDLATARQEIEQLKGSVAQLKANQEKMSRGVAKASGQNPRPQTSPMSAMAALPPRPVAAAPARKPMQPLRPSQPAPAPTMP